MENLLELKAKESMGVTVLKHEINGQVRKKANYYLTMLTGERESERG